MGDASHPVEKGSRSRAGEGEVVEGSCGASEDCTPVLSVADRGLSLLIRGCERRVSGVWQRKGASGRATGGRTRACRSGIRGSLPPYGRDLDGATGEQRGRLRLA